MVDVERAWGAICRGEAAPGRLDGFFSLCRVVGVGAGGDGGRLSERLC